jgi:hypothetical protein
MFASIAVFTGTSKFEQIKMWDVRARAPVYELATGNNRVESLAWDSKRNSLYASTECTYMDRLGFRHGYRGGYMPDRPLPENEDEDDEYDGDYERCWPDRAFHTEAYFGYTFDAGEHRVCACFQLSDMVEPLTTLISDRYAFKENPDTSILPPYGDARVAEMESFW